MQLLNLFLFWLFFGGLASYIARRKGRHPLAWFGIGLFLGLLGVALALILPRPKKKKPKPTAKKALPERSDAWLKLWYYMDGSHTQQGPLEFPDFIKLHQDTSISSTTLVWGEGMKEWKPLSDLPELVREMQA